MDYLEFQVKKANRDFYDIVGSSYEAIDGRRSDKLICYVSEQLKSISENTEADAILDLGCGSGFVSRIAAKYFKTRFAVDISFHIVRVIEDDTLHKLTADSDFIPFQNESLNSVASFAVLHHCYAYEKMVSEIYRVLKEGGIFYSDHDMDESFFKRFKPLLKIYRSINDASRHYLSNFHQLSEEIYHCSEFHEEGIPSEKIEHLLKQIGFKDVRFEYHWYGLSSLTDKIFGKKSYQRGYAPLTRIIAVK